MDARDSRKVAWRCPGMLPAACADFYAGHVHILMVRVLRTVSLHVEGPHAVPPFRCTFRCPGFSPFRRSVRRFSMDLLASVESVIY